LLPRGLANRLSQFLNVVSMSDGGSIGDAGEPVPRRRWQLGG
jgi:hypothetical protein